MKTSHFIITILFFTSCKTKYQEVFEKFDNGHPKEVRVYDDKKKKDDYDIIFYFQNDTVKFRGTVKNNQYVGQKISYYETGILREIDSLIKPCDFDFCCCDGKVTWFDSSGNLAETIEARNGEKNGKAFIYKQNGKLDITKVYKDGKKMVRQFIFMTMV
jgi:antitoxin component YwqK of YwqJK toxin-antitoxin module